MFLSCGDSLFDVYASGDETDVSTISLAGRVGGSPLNVALGLARLGHDAAFFTKMSNDAFGQRIRNFMSREGIDQRFLIPTERNTTLAMVSLSPQGTPQYNFYIDGTADRSIEPAEVPSSFPDDLHAIHLASYSTVTEPTASALAHLVSQEHGRRFISYDPNIRASIEPDLDVWRSRVDATLPFATLVKASEEDLELIYPGRNVETVLGDWIAAGAALAVVTRGENGALGLTRNGVAAQVSGVSVTVADTVGAGDTFQAALLAKLFEDKRLSDAHLADFDQPMLEDLMGFAVKAAAITCSRRGADLPRRSDLGLAPLV